MDTTTELGKLQAERAAVGSRVFDLERARRSANEEVASASARLTDAERAGASPSTLRKIEAELSRARELAGQPWSERVAGARAEVRDVELIS